MRSAATVLYDQAFGAKIALAIPDENSRLTLYERCFDAQYAFVAIDDGELLGLAGFSTPDGALTAAIDLDLLTETLGWPGGLRAALVLSLYERKAAQGELLMDGIVVDAAARGRGLGTSLLNAVIDYAARSGYKQVRLDVIDTNPRARALYEKLGFSAVGTEHFGYLKRILGFGAATEMRYSLAGKFAERTTNEMKTPMAMRDLDSLLASMKPELNPGRYAYCVVAADHDTSAISPVVTVKESEGMTVVVAEADALNEQLDIQLVVEWITLRVHSDLEAVGLTAAFAQTLGDAGISCNVVAGAFHDHIFVPAGDGERAVALLTERQLRARRAMSG